MREASTDYIVKEELPITQNFKLLREDGLARIEDYSDYEWTNFNPSDPGITILDQICFALTELGYCNDFPVKDILTAPNGKLIFEDQYYSPEQILTTSPVSIDDYIRYVIDQVEYVTNATITPIKTSISAYMVYVKIDKTITNPDTIKSICSATFYALNNARNLCETFVVQPLQSLKVFLSGDIYVNKAIDIKTLLSELQSKVDNYIFPNVQQKGYDKLNEDGIPTNAIFNGPILKNGWIISEDLKPKKNTLYATEVNTLISSLNGVETVLKLEFSDSVASTMITCLESQIIDLDVIESFNCKQLKIYVNGKDIDDEITNELIETTKQTYQLETAVGQKSVSAIVLEPELPVGRYRDINSYFSIQNTLPEIYRVGENALESGVSNYQIAQSRQLMGYLTLIDQVLANQFSQLANINNLFSFKNATTADPSDREIFYETHDGPQKMKGSYPVPYESFSPTYFYQSLYDIPNIRPLLRNNDIFNFSIKYISKKDLETRSWKDYVKDPYNSYIWGIKNFIEDDEISYTRRNNILNHLLARHGESPLMIDAIIDGSKYTGDKIQDQVIFKSLLLQNLGLLSYYRQKAYNFIGADYIIQKNAEGIQKLGTELKEIVEQLEGIEEAFTPIELTKDFIFNSQLIDGQEKLRSKDFINYSGIELKLNLLFGLNVLYTDFITNYGYPKSDKKHPAPPELEIVQAEWLIRQRKGCLLIETNLLLQVANFQAIIIQELVFKERYWATAGNLNYEDAVIIHNWLNTSDDKTIQDQLDIENPCLYINGKTYALNCYETIYLEDNWIQHPTNLSNMSYAITANWGKDIRTYFEDPLFNNSVDVIFPQYIKTINNDDFKDRLALFFESSGPVQIEFRPHYLPALKLEIVIILYILFHDKLIYKDKTSTRKKKYRARRKILKKSARKLVQHIIESNTNVE